METTGFGEQNLFEESDNEGHANIDENNKLKRKRNLSENDLFVKNNDERIKKINMQNVEICKEEVDNKSNSDGFQIKSNVSDNKNAVETAPLWSIEESLFYPMGIRNHYIVGVNKSVLLIWSDLSVINFVIKKNPKTKQTKTTRIRLFVPNGEKIKDIQILEFNTLLLLESGRVNYFSSSKSMHTLQWLDNVRCMAAYLSGFSVIRLTSEKKLVLEVYEDVIDMGKNATGPIKHKYDITFDERNLFNCGWEDEHYYLLSTVINENNLKFLQLVTRNTFNLDYQKELHLFAISGNVFSLVPDIDATYHIEMMFSYSSNVGIIKLDFERNLFFIFLQCGVIDIWSISMSSKWQQLRHQTHYIGSEHTSFSYSDCRAALYFTDENEVSEFRFSIVLESEELVLHETHKAIPGILVCTWIEAIEQLVCLDCNNIFHQLSFSEILDRPVVQKNQSVIKTAEFEKFNTLYELTSQRVAQLLDKAHIIQQLNELPKIIHHDIEQQYRKQELLAVSGKRRYYKTFLNARLEFSIGTLNLFENDVVPLYTQNQFMLHQRTLLALIYFEIEQNEIFQNSIWQLNLQFNGLHHIFTLPENLLLKKLCFVVPLDMCSQKLLPEFHLHLYTFVSCAHNHVAIVLPVSIVINYKTVAQLFTFGKFCCYIQSLRSQYQLGDLLKHFNRQPTLLTSNEIKCCLNISNQIKLKSIFKVDEMINEKNIFELYFLGSKISVCYNTTKNMVVLISNDAVSLFYMKMYFQFVSEQQSSQDGNENLEDARQKFLRYQCNVERLYGTLQDADNEELNEKNYIAQKLKLLKELYLKIRNELSLPLFL